MGSEVVTNVNVPVDDTMVMKRPIEAVSPTLYTTLTKR
jgi:hypothetical protein